MKRILVIATALLIISLASTTSPYNIRAVHASAYIDPLLASAQAASSPSTAAQVIIVLNHIPTSSDAQAFRAFSKTSFPMTRLPMILTYTNYGNLTNMASYPGVQSLWYNRQLTYYGNVQTVTHSYGEVPTAHS